MRWDLEDLPLKIRRGSKVDLDSEGKHFTFLRAFVVICYSHMCSTLFMNILTLSFHFYHCLIS